MSWVVRLVVALACILSGCSGTTPYVSDAEDNLFITTDTQSGFLSGVDASLDIYRLNENCVSHYRGTVVLGDALVPVGIETGEPVQLVFNFESSSFLANSNSSISYDVVLYPEFGYHYDVDVSYRNDIYNVEISERPRAISESVPMTVRVKERDCNRQT